MPINNNKFDPAPLILFLFSFFLRLLLISKGPYHLDCLNLAVFSQKTLETGSLHGLFGPGYPLTILFGSLFLFMGRFFSQNDPVFAVNFMSVVFSALSVPILYLITKKLFDPVSAILSSIIFSITPIFLGISVFGKSHTPSIFFLLLGLYYILRFQETGKKKNLWIGGIAIGLMGACRLQDMILMIIPFSFLCLFGVNNDKESSRSSLSKKLSPFKNIFLFWALAFAVAIIFHAPYLSKNHPLDYPNHVALFWQQGAIENFRGGFSSSLVISIIFFLKTFTEAGFVLSLFGLILIARKLPRLAVFFLLWILIPLFFYGNLNSTVPRFFAFILPALIMAQGYMFAYLTRINALFRTTSLILYGIILYLSFTFIFPLVYVRHAYALLPDYVTWVSGKIEKNAHLITIDDRPFYNYYGNFNIFGRPIHFKTLKDEDLVRFKQKLDSLLSNNIPVYITSVALNTYDPDKKFSSLIKNNYKMEIVGEKLYEDWHRGILKQRIFYNRLIRIKKKN